MDKRTVMGLSSETDLYKGKSRSEIMLRMVTENQSENTLVDSTNVPNSQHIQTPKFSAAFELIDQDENLSTHENNIDDSGEINKGFHGNEENIPPMSLVVSPVEEQTSSMSDYLQPPKAGPSVAKTAISGQFVVHVNIEDPTKMQITRRKQVEYYISPMNSNESDLDVSDTDPSYSNTDDKYKKWAMSAAAPSKHTPHSSNNSSSSSSSSRSGDSSDTSSSSGSSPDSASADSTVETKKGRKRLRKPNEWKQNRAKFLRNSGATYTSMVKTETNIPKNIPARSIKPTCPATCRLKCGDKISHEERTSLFKKFWELADINRQRSFIVSCTKSVIPKYKYTNAENPRHYNKAFFLTVDENSIRVCKTFFKNTLDISDRTIRTAISKVDGNGFIKTDFRGKHESHKKLDEQLLLDIRNHIDSIPRIESHYVRANTTREFIDGGKTISDIFKDFKDKQLISNRTTCEYFTFYKVFTTEFNLGFFQPRKDQCDLCFSYENATEEAKELLKEKYLLHHEEKELSRKEKSYDRESIEENKKVIIYDLQAVLQCPRGDISAFYYKSKLNSYNFTMAELEKIKPNEKNCAYGKVNCFYWNEADAKRGAIEIGSCILKYLESVCGDVPLDIIFYSDNCCGQNKNRYIASMYLFAVNNMNIRSITHKFLIKGHTQNEGDNVHSLIEKEIKKT